MKKFALAIPVVLLSLTLAACGNSNATESSSSSSNHNTKVNVTKNTSSDNSSSDNPSSDNSSSSANSNSSSSVNNSSATSTTNVKVNATSSRLNQLNKQLTTALGNIALPQADGLENGSNNLNIRYTGNTSNYQIFYSVGNQPTTFNNPTLKQQNAYAILQKQTYGSKSDAEAQINYLPKSVNQGLPSVDLGSGITGYRDSGAGNIHLLWNEGHWSLSVHAINIKNQDPEPLAKQIVSLLNQYSLPAPDKVGQINFDVNINPGARDQIISWQDGNVVYSITAHDPVTAIKMAASIH